MERAVYNSEDGKWYPEHAAPWKIRFVNKGRGDKIPPLVFALADTYTEAFTKLFGYAPVLPPIVRGVRPAVLA